MKELTENQKEFLMNIFFVNDKFPGWRSIAESLFGASHSCVVAGTKCIWEGGVGNFIKLESSPDHIYCSKYVFDFEGFLSSAFLKDIVSYVVENKERELKQFETELEDLKGLR